MSIGNSNSVAMSVGNNKTKIPTEFSMDIQTDKRAKKKFPPPSYQRNILSVKFNGNVVGDSVGNCGTDL
jgi:hypothetical protein